ncbi:MAG TPA: prepilin-type N-terminal cleavage/methylation domain-containing protein [Kineosporiaceae bacterium]
MLARIRTSVDERDQGFTLIELLVVMIIIGILAAIAIPVFLNQRQKAVDTSIKSDLKAAADFEETWFVDHSAYSTTKTDFTGASVKFSGTNKIEAAVNALGTGYCLRGSNAGGSNASGFFWYDSLLGGLQPNGSTTTVPTGACNGLSSFTQIS